MLQSALLGVFRAPLLEEGYAIGLNWLGKIVMWIVEGIGIVGLGIIVFTLVLKAITLPFDIYQRVKMRKQTLIMREMKPELDKLQKQYANDKTMYNQKMMELYKKNGYSMLGACLPMILSLVILIVAFQAFRLYSDYANLKMYVDMSAAYNAAVYKNGVKDDGVRYRLHRDDVEDDEYTITLGEGGAITWEEGGTIPSGKDNILYEMYSETAGEEEGENAGEVLRYIRVSSPDPDKYLFYRYSLDDEEMKARYYADSAKLKAYLETQPAEKKDKEGNTVLDKDGNPVPSDEATFLAAINAAEDEDGREKACSDYIVKVGGTAAADWYHENDAHFLWVKNVWYPDVSYNHPIPSTQADFIKQFNRTVTLENGKKSTLAAVVSDTQYNNLTSELSSEKKAANGYFILIILSIGLMVGSQLITMKSQKESDKYQTVDGQGAKTQKVMLVMMPLIYAIFAFMYSAAFTIYMTMSSLLSIIVTLLCNLILGKVFKNKEEKEIKEQYSRKLPWQNNNGKKTKKSKGKK